MKKSGAKKLFSLLSASVLTVGAMAFALSGCAEEQNNLLVAYSFDETTGNRTINGANGKSYKIDYVFNAENQDKIYKPSSDPLLKQGVMGK